jgi:hypothetical protein
VRSGTPLGCHEDALLPFWLGEVGARARPCSDCSVRGGRTSELSGGDVLPSPSNLVHTEGVPGSGPYRRASIKTPSFSTTKLPSSSCVEDGRSRTPTSIMGSADLGIVVPISIVSCKMLVAVASISSLSTERIVSFDR